MDGRKEEEEEKKGKRKKMSQTEKTQERGVERERESNRLRLTSITLEKNEFFH